MYFSREILDELFSNDLYDLGRISANHVEEGLADRTYVTEADNQKSTS